MYNIHVKKYSLFALRSPFFLFCSGCSDEEFTFKCYRFLNGGGTKEHCFFNSYHIHIGICIEGTSMHLNCLHDKWKKV